MQDRSGIRADKVGRCKGRGAGCETAGSASSVHPNHGGEGRDDKEIVVANAQFDHQDNARTTNPHQVKILSRAFRPLRLTVHARFGFVVNF
jgi:hypothetical protein